MMRIKPKSVAARRTRGQQTKQQRQRGATLVEFALVSPLLFLLMMATIDLSALMWADLSMQHAVREGARYALTGRTDGYASAGDRYLQVIQAIKDNSMGVYDKVNPRIEVKLNGTDSSYGSSSAYDSGMFGGAGDLVVLKFDCTWPLMTPLMRPFFSGGTYKFSVATTFNNE